MDLQTQIVKSNIYVQSMPYYATVTIYLSINRS